MSSNVTLPRTLSGPLCSPTLLLTLLIYSAASVAGRMQDLNGNPCGHMEPATGAWNYWDQPAFMSEKERAANESRRAELSAHAWAIDDNWANHLAPAKAQMNTETGTGVGGSVSENLHGTLIRIPNHARALSMLTEYAFIIKKKPRHKPLQRRPECYFQAAIAFAPQDSFAYGLYAIYLYRLQKYELALENFNKALELQPSSSELWYNKGLILVHLDRLNEAAEAARNAYRRGHKLRGLSAMLARRGVKLDLTAARDESNKDK